jgi:hypothetical protein
MRAESNNPLVGNTSPSRGNKVGEIRSGITEGVGERPGHETSSGYLHCRRRGAKILLRPAFRKSPRSVGPEPPSRRRPLSSTGTGGVEARRDALTALRLAPARVTQSTTPSKSKTESGDYFTSSSGALSCARPSSPQTSSSSFASSPCCPPSLSEWRLSSSARGDREHCIRITTAR